jgi:hypothetical protein
MRATPARLVRNALRRVALGMRRVGVRLAPRLISNPLFDADWYGSRHPDAPRDARAAYAHYRRQGRRAGYAPNPMFDVDWYVARYKDIVASGIDPLDHYFLYGAREGRDPSDRFSTNWYLAANPDVQASGAHPLLHYLRHGSREGRLPRPMRTPQTPH